MSSHVCSGWDPMEIMEDFHQLEAKMNTIRVPAEVSLTGPSATKWSLTSRLGRGRQGCDLLESGHGKETPD
eukprot:764148-Hanusia_phi.AAC.8